MANTVIDRFSLEGKVAIVTGGSSGLGVAFAKALPEAGAEVVLAARRADRLEQTSHLVEERGRRALLVAADVSLPEAAGHVVDAAMSEFGHVDGVGSSSCSATAWRSDPIAPPDRNRF